MESSTGCRASFSGVHRLSSPCFPLLLFPLTWESSLNVQSLNWLLVGVSETQTQPAITSPSVAMDTKMPMNGRGLRGKYLGKNTARNISNYSSTEATWGKSESWWYLTPALGTGSPPWVPAPVFLKPRWSTFLLILWTSSGSFLKSLFLLTRIQSKLANPTQ